MDGAILICHPKFLWGHKNLSNILSLPGGVVSPKCLKGCSLGILATKKRGLVLFLGISKICKIGES